MDKIPFNVKHPIINKIFGFFILLVLIGIGFAFLYFVVFVGIAKTVNLIKETLSKLDAVVVVALITGSVSLLGVIISSIIAKVIDYKRTRREYLAQKREGPYGEFVEVYYKLSQNKDGKYTEKETIDDISSFSKQLILYGSRPVVKNWVKFRKNGAKPDMAEENLFIMEKIMNAMRKDLGVKKVKEGEILAFNVNDIDEAMKKRKNRKK